MFNSHELHDSTFPTLEAYDGSWLEMLENPDASLPHREGFGGPEAPQKDVGASRESAGRGPVV
jgi:hypothetical protein